MGHFIEGEQEGVDRFPHARVQDAVQAAKWLLDLSPHEVDFPAPSAERVMALRRLLRVGMTPRVRIYVASNVSLSWDEEEAASLIEKLLPDARLAYFGPDELYRLLKSSRRKVNTSFRLAGQSVANELNWKRSVLGKMSADDVARILQLNEDELLHRDVGHS